MQYRYFAIVMLASMPFWLVGLVTDWVLLPGVPASAMMFAAPAIAAVFMLLGPGSKLSIWAWFRGHFSAPREKTPGWIFVAVLIPVVVLLITYTCAQFFGSSTPSPPEPAGIPAQFALLFLLFFVPALLEELGWTGYAFPRLHQRYSALLSSLVLGSVWAVWHWIPLLQIGRDLEWIAWWSITAIALRIMICFLAVNAPMPVLVATAFHASINASWQLYPVAGSHYDPALHSVVLIFACALMVLFSGKQLRVGSPNSSLKRTDQSLRD